MYTNKKGFDEKLSIFSPGRNSMKLPLGTFFFLVSWHADFSVLLKALFVLLNALGKYFFQLT
jgi:hypothetical protein